MKKSVVVIITILVLASKGWTLSGTYYIGGTNPGVNWYASFTSAISALNSSGSTGSGVTFIVRSGTYSTATTSESFPLNITTLTGSASTPILFQKESGTVNISCGTTTGTDYPIVKLTGADYVTFDGIDISATTNTPLTGYYCVDVSASNGSQNNTIRNCIVTMSRSAAGARAIYFKVSTNAVLLRGGTNSFNTIQNVIIHNTQIGIDLYGDSRGGVYHDTANTIKNCQIGVGTANDIQGSTTGSYGILARAQAAMIIQDNEIANVTSTSTANDGYVGVSDALGMYLFDIDKGTKIERNKIHDISHSGGASVQRSAIGLFCDGEAYVNNNVIWNLSHAYAGTAIQSVTGGANTGINYNPGWGVFGMVIRNANGTASDWIKVANNSILINTNTRVSSVCIYVGQGYDTLRNNICANITANQTTAKHLGMVKAGASSPNINYNIIYTPNTNGIIADTSSSNGNMLYDLTWSQWRASGRDANGYNSDPLFISSTNLHLTSYSGTAASNSAQPGWVTVDIDGQTRSVTPDIGADESTLALRLSPPSTVLFSTVTSSSIVVNWSAVTNATQYALEYSSDGASYTTLTTTNAATSIYTHSGIGTGNSYYSYRVFALNVDTVSSATATVSSTYTLALTPSAPNASNVLTTTADITPANASSPSNSAQTQYAIAVGAQYVQIDGTLGASAAWQTLSNWGTCHVSGLSQGTTYTFTTIARNGNNLQTSVSPAASITTLVPPPSAVSFGTATTTSIVVRWRSVTNASRYQIEYSSDGSSYSLLSTAVTDTSYSHTGFTFGNTGYYYRVYAFNSNSVQSLTATASAIVYSLANTPQKPIVSQVNTHSFHCTPSNSVAPANSAVTLYAIRVGSQYVQSNGTLGVSPVWEELTSWSTTVVDPVTQNSNYTVSVQARNGDGITTAFSADTTVSTLASAPGLLTPSNHSTLSIQLNWSPISNATYKLEYGNDTTTFTTLVTNLTDTFFVDTNFSIACMERYYRLYSINLHGQLNSTPGPIGNFTTLANTPGAPTVSNPTTTTFQVTPHNASNPSNSDSTKYAIMVGSQYVNHAGALAASPDWYTLLQWQTVTVTGLNPSTQYAVKVKARSHGENIETAFSSAVQIVTLSQSRPPAPASVSITARTTTSLHVDWIAPATIGTLASYEIQSSSTSASSGFSVLATDLHLHPSQYINTGLSSFTRYWYRVYGKNSEGLLSETYVSVDDTTRANWHVPNELGNSNQNPQSSWNPSMPADSLTHGQPAASISFPATSGSATNPQSVLFQWNSRSDMIQAAGLDTVELSFIAPVSKCIDRFWRIEAPTGSRFNASLTLRFTSRDLPVGVNNLSDFTARVISKHGTQQWTYYSCTISGPDGYGVYSATVDNIYEFSVWTVLFTEPLLPVSLEVFTAENDNQGVALHWRTATEHNVDHYRIDRQKAGASVERSVTIPSLSENGFSATSLDYIWHDQDNLDYETQYVYILTEIDLDGAVTELSRSSVTTLPEGHALIRAYPSPFNAFLTLEFSLVQLEQANVMLFDNNGRLAAKIFEGEGGRIKTRVTYDARHLSSGVYFVRLTSSTASSTTRVVLIK